MRWPLKEFLNALLEIRHLLSSLAASGIAATDSSPKRSSDGVLRKLRRGERTNTQVKLDDASHFSGLAIKNLKQAIEGLPPES